jgi:hypothetical protein
MSFAIRGRLGSAATVTRLPRCSTSVATFDLKSERRVAPARCCGRPNSTARAPRLEPDGCPFRIKRQELDLI